MFQFSGLAPARKQVTGLLPAGLPHSDISGSILLGRSPELLAAVHVLLRLHKPRHLPCALAYFLLRASRHIAATTSRIVAATFYETSSLFIFRHEGNEASLLLVLKLCQRTCTTSHRDRWRIRESNP